jgi:hypothetical protein
LRLKHLRSTPKQPTNISTQSSATFPNKTDATNTVFLDYVRIQTPDKQYVSADYIIENGLPEEVIDCLIEQIGCNLVGGLKILGFFLPSSVFSSQAAIAIDGKIKERLNFIRASKEFDSEHTFVYFTNMKNLKIYAFKLSDQSVINYPTIKFKEITELVSAAHFFVNRTYAVSEEGSGALEDASVQFDVR